MKYDENEKQQLVSRHQNGESVASICSRLGIPRSTFYSWITFYAQTVTPNGRIVSAKKLDAL